MVVRASVAVALLFLGLAVLPSDAGADVAATGAATTCDTGLLVTKNTSGLIAPSDVGGLYPHPISWCRYAVTVDGETAWGYLAYPEDVTPTKLVVVAHGCCNNLRPSPGWDEARAKSWDLQEAAAGLGVAAVGMDFRGSGNFDVWNGHLDTIAATEDLQARWPIDTTVLYGGSMGGTVSGLAAAARPDLYDAWVNIFGAVNLFEIFLTFGFTPGIVPSADAENPTGSWMVEEMGGLPAAVPAEWIKRSPVFQAHRMVGLPRAYHCYGAGDAYVPITQGIEMHNALVAAGVPSSLFVNVADRGAVQGPYRPGVGGSGPSGKMTVLDETDTGREPQTVGPVWLFQDPDLGPVGVPRITVPGTIGPVKVADPKGYAGTGAGDPWMPGPAAHDPRSYAPCPSIVAGLLAGGPVDVGPDVVQVHDQYTAWVQPRVESEDPTGLLDGALPRDIHVETPDGLPAVDSTPAYDALMGVFAQAQ